MPYKGYRERSVRNCFGKQLHTSLLDILIVTNKASASWNSSFRNGAQVTQWMMKETWVLLSCLLFPLHITFSEIKFWKKKM